MGSLSLGEVPGAAVTSLLATHIAHKCWLCGTFTGEYRPLRCDANALIMGSASN